MTVNLSPNQLVRQGKSPDPRDSALPLFFLNRQNFGKKNSIITLSEPLALRRRGLAEACTHACTIGGDTMTSLRQILANQRNSQRSTGPRTEAGLEASKRN